MFQTVILFKNMKGLPFLNTDEHDFKIENFSLNKKKKNNDEEGEEEEFEKEFYAEKKVSQNLFKIIRFRQVTEHFSHEN